MCRTRGWVLLCALLLSVASPTRAQEVGPSLFLPRAPVVQARDAATMDDAPLRSLVLPGWGQLHLGQQRGWAYLALEAAGWAAWANRRMAGGDLRDQYRDLAWSSARIQAGERQDGDFAYYERLTKWDRSGAFDSDPGLAGIQPEAEVDAFNGSIWALARDIFVAPGATPDPDDPAYRQALAYYVARAYGPSLLWDWSGVPADKERYGALITESDDRFRQATTALGVIIANHFISAVDAYVSGESRHRSTPIAVWAEPSGVGTRWSAVFRLRTP